MPLVMEFTRMATPLLWSPPKAMNFTPNHDCKYVLLLICGWCQSLLYHKDDGYFNQDIWLSQLHVCSLHTWHWTCDEECVGYFLSNGCWDGWLSSRVIVVLQPISGDRVWKARYAGFACYILSTYHNTYYLGNMHPTHACVRAFCLMTIRETRRSNWEFLFANQQDNIQLGCMQLRYA